MACVLNGNITKNDVESTTNKKFSMSLYIVLKNFQFGWKHAIKHTYGKGVCIQSHLWLMHIECKFRYFDARKQLAGGEGKRVKESESESEKEIK